MTKTTRFISFGVAALLLGLLGGGGYAWYQALRQTPANALAASDSSYAAALVAYRQGNDATAVVRFHEAQLHAESALGLLEQYRVDPRPRQPEEIAGLLRHEGLAHFAKLKALRGRAVAKARSEARPPPSLEGVSADQGEAYFAKLYPTRVPDESLRGEALASLRVAALRLPDVEAVQREAVQQELQFEPKHWPHAQVVAGQLQKLQPNDPAARYLLARFEFEQPVVSGGPANPLALAKRSQERMKKAQEHLAIVKAGENPARWRTAYLEAQILCWQVQHFRDPNHRKPEREQEARTALLALLFEPPQGVLPRAAGIQSFYPLSRLDTEGLLALHALGVDLAVQQRRQGATEHIPDVAMAVGHLVAVVRKLHSDQATPLQKSLCFRYLVQAGALAQPFMPVEQENWIALLSQGRVGCTEALAMAEGDLAVLQNWAELLGREATRATSPATASALRKEALSCVQASLKAGHARKYSTDILVQLHDLAARLLGQQGAGRDEVHPHLAVMQSAKQPAMQAMGFLLEGALFEQEGKLELARDLFLRAASLGGSAEAGRRAHLALAPLHLALGNPAASLQSLTEVEKLLGQWQRLAAEERAWVQRYLKGPQEIALLKLQAHLAAARLAYAQLNLERETAAQMMTEHEQAAFGVLSRLEEAAPTRRMARETVAAHLLATRRFDQAAEQVAALQRDYPDSLNTLRLGNELKRRQGPNSSSAAEIARRIQQFINRYPDNVAARLYWAEWLASQGRQAEAVAFLDDPAQFGESARDARWQALRDLGCRAPAETAAGVTQASSLMNAAPVLNAAEFRGPALAKESPGLLKCQQAQQAAARGDWAEAAKRLTAALDYTTLRPQVRTQLQGLLIAQARKNPAEVKALLIELMQQAPEEPTLLAAFAECCFLLGEFGGSVAKLTQVNDLQTALVAYEMVSRRDDPVGVEASLLRASFLRRLNRPDLARAEVGRLLGRAPEQTTALALAIELAIEAEEPAARGEALSLVPRLRGLLPDSPLPYLLEAQLLSVMGKGLEAAATLADCRLRFPACGPAYANQFMLALQSGDVGAAQKVVKEWHVALPRDLLARQAEVRCLATTGNLDQARALHKQLLGQCKDSNQQSQVTLLLAQALVEANALAEAESWLTQWVKQQPDSEPALLLLGNVHLQQYRRTTGEERRQAATQAQSAYARVYHAHKGHLVAGNNLAWLMVTTGGDAEDALRLLREVRANRWTGQPQPAELLPASLLDTYGQVFAKVGGPSHAAEAKELFVAARKRYPRDPRFCYYLGQAYAAAGEKPAAREQFAAALVLAEQSEGKGLLALMPHFKEDVQAAKKTVE